MLNEKTKTETGNCAFVEGYWGKTPNDNKLPWPQENEAPWEGQKEFLDALERESRGYLSTNTLQRFELLSIVW